MELILERDGREYWLQVIDQGSEFRPPFAGAPYPVLVWDTRGGRTDRELEQLASKLVASNVRYGVCGGQECERWHDALDWAFLEQHLEAEEYDARFVMTSWHTGEPPDEVAFFLLANTNFDAHDFRRFLVLQVGSDWAVSHSLREAIGEQAELAGEDDEPDEEWSTDAV